MITSEEFVERLKRLKSNCYMHGELIQRDDPRMMVSSKDIRMSFDLVDDPRFKDLLVTKSHLTGKPINRFTHIHQSTDDLLKKQLMTRKLCHLSGTCIQRCMGIDMMNALSIVSKEADEKSGGKTEYHDRFLAFLKEFQEKDMVGAAAQSDVKGNRVLRPSQQADPDLYLRVVEENAEGVVVKGCKVHTSIGPYCDELIVTPCRSLKADEEDWAICFSIPADTEGVHLLIEAANPTPRKAFPAEMAEHGVAHSTTIFDNVLVPWERVFVYKDPQLASRAALLFALYHRHSYCGCKPAYTDILMGTTALVAEVSGIDRQQHVRHKLADMISVAELVFAAGFAASHNATRASSGTYIPDVVYCNVGRRHAGLNIYHEYELLCDICGGQPQTMPYEEEYADPKWRPYLDKYFARKADVDPETVHRVFRLAQDLMAGPTAANMQIAGVHGGGSPIMEEIAVWGQYDVEAKKNIAKNLAGIPIGKPTNAEAKK